MAQVLNVQNRVVEHPNRYKLNPVSGEANTYDFEKVPGEISNAGTPYNRGVMNKIDCIMKYEKITGVYNPLTELVEYEHGYFDSNNLVENMRLLVQGANTPDAPATNLELIQSDTSIGNYYADHKSIKLSNGNIFVFGHASATAGTGYFSIIKQDGTVLKSTTNIGSGYNEGDIIELSNGNIALAGRGGSNATCYYSIYDNQGNVVLSSRSWLNNIYTVRLVQTPNKNIFIIANDSNGLLRYRIIKEDGTIVESEKISANSTYSENETILLSNNNIMVIGHRNNNSDRPCYALIINQDGTILKENILIGNGLYYPNLKEMPNNNIVITGTASNNIGNFAIVDNDLNIIKNVTSLGDIGTTVNKIYILSNNTVAFYSSKGYVSIIDNNGDFIVNTKNVFGSNKSSLSLLEINNGNILLISEGTYFVITDKRLNVIKSESAIFSTSNFNLVESIELDDKNIIIVGNDGNPAGHFCVLKPYADNFKVAINNIPVDTPIEEGKYYELVLNPKYKWLNKDFSLIDSATIKNTDNVTITIDSTYTENLLNICDGNTNSFGTVGKPNANCIIDLGEIKNIKKIKYYISQPSSISSTSTLQYSTNGINWIVIDPKLKDVTITDIDLIINARYIKLDNIDSSSSGKMMIGEIDIMYLSNGLEFIAEEVRNAN